MRFSNMSKPVETCLNLFRFNMIWIDAILKHVWTCPNMSKLVQIQYDMNWCDMILKHVWTCWNLVKLARNQYYYDSYDSQTCLNLFRFNMIQIVTIHMILKPVWTCSNLSEHVQTCLNLSRFNMIRIVTIHTSLNQQWLDMTKNPYWFV